MEIARHLIEKGMLIMLSKEDMLLFEQKFSDLNLITTGLVLFYYLLFGLFGNIHMADELYVVSGFAVLSLVDFILTKFYSVNLNTDIPKRILKYIMLLLLGWATLFTENIWYSTVLLIALYFDISFQTLFLFDITEYFSRMSVLLYTCSPITLVYLIGLIFSEQNNFLFFIIVIVLSVIAMVIYSMIRWLSEFANIFFNKINNLNGIAATNKEENDSIKIQKNRLEQINEQLSIERFKLEQANETISKNNEEMKIQNTIVNAAAKALDINRLLECLTDASIMSMKLDLVSFLILCEDGEDSRFLYSSKYTRASSMGKGNLSLMENKEFAQTYINNGAVVEISRNANLEIDALTGTKIHSISITPIVINENSMGLYIFGSINENSFLNNDVFRNSLFNNITLAVNNALLYSQMRTMATKDGLTDIYNRRYFNSIYDSIIQRCIQNDSPLTVILFDIDKFKKINDTYGHIFGDEVIRYCGHTALQYAKKYNGLPVRYGGEEFIIVFPQKNTADAEGIMREMHAEIKQHKFNTEDTEIRINISIGIASYPENCENTNDLLNSADNAMYASKKNGRGRITIYNKDIMV